MPLFLYTASWFVHVCLTFIFQGELCAIISRMEEQPGTRVVPFCVEHVGLQESPRYLNAAFIADQVKVRFQLVNEVERNLRFKDHSMAERVSTVHVTMYSFTMC